MLLYDLNFFLQATIVEALGHEARDKHKFDIALKYAKGKLTDFRSEERRKVRYDDIVINLAIMYCLMAGTGARSLC